MTVSDFLNIADTVSIINQNALSKAHKAARMLGGIALSTLVIFKMSSLVSLVRSIQDMRNCASSTEEAKGSEVFFLQLFSVLSDIWLSGLEMLFSGSRSIGRLEFRNSLSGK